MKKVMMPFLTSIAACLMLTASPEALLEKPQEFTKVIAEEFPITADGKTMLDNQHGIIQVNTWAKNEVRIVVTIKVEAKSESVGQEVIDDVDIDFDASSNQVSARTILNGNWNFGWKSDVKSREIHYEVFLPATNFLEIEQSHGKVFIQDDMAAGGKFDLSHADLEAGDFGGNVDFSFSHGKGEVGNVKDVKVRVSHSNLKAGTVGNAEVSCSHGSFNASAAGEVDAGVSHGGVYLSRAINFSANSVNHGQVEIGEVGNFKANGNHSNFQIKTVNGDINVDMGHGRLNAGLANKFGSVNLVGSHTQFNIGIPSNGQFSFEARGSYAGISYPSQMDINYLVEKNTSKEVRGKMGSGNQGSISAKMSHGGFRLQMN